MSKPGDARIDALIELVCLVVVAASLAALWMAMAR